MFCISDNRRYYDPKYLIDKIEELIQDVRVHPILPPLDPPSLYSTTRPWDPENTHVVDEKDDEQDDEKQDKHTQN